MSDAPFKSTESGPGGPRAWLAALLRGGAAEGEALPARPLLLAFLALFGGVMLLISLVGEQGLISYLQLRDRRDNLRDDVARLEQNQERLARQVRALRGNKDYIELLARQKLGYVRPGDRVIQLPPRKP